jgi:hypothetical protein
MSTTTTTSTQANSVILDGEEKNIKYLAKIISSILREVIEDHASGITNFKKRASNNSEEKIPFQCEKRDCNIF